MSEDKEEYCENLSCGVDGELCEDCKKDSQQDKEESLVLFEQPADSLRGKGEDLK